ncbi:hypothetical protein GCM10009634_07190 [Saccharothrix xinjiangensis]
MGSGSESPLRTPRGLGQRLALERPAKPDRNSPPRTLPQGFGNDPLPNAPTAAHSPNAPIATRPRARSAGVPARGSPAFKSAGGMRQNGWVDPGSVDNPRGQ